MIIKRSLIIFSVNKKLYIYTKKYLVTNIFIVPIIVGITALLVATYFFPDEIFKRYLVGFSIISAYYVGKSL